MRGGDRVIESKADARFFRRIAASQASRSESRSAAGVPPITSLMDLAAALSYSGHSYPLGMNQTMPGSPYIEPASGFVGMVQGVHQRHGVVSAAVIARALLLSQLHFALRKRYGTDRGLFAGPGLSVLDQFPVPRPRSLMAMEMQASYDGNAYVVRRNGKTRLVNPQTMTVVLGSEDEVDPTTAEGQLVLEPVGYFYKSLGNPSAKPLWLWPHEVAQWAPEPDPICWWRGASWVSSVIRDIATDFQISDHLNQFFKHAATPNLSVSFDASLSSDQVKEYAKLIEDGHAGSVNAWRTMVLGGGADVSVVGSDLSKLTYKDVQGGLETRVALRSRVPASILSIREGMQGSSLTAGNYNSSRRMWADGWFSPTADGLCAALDHLVSHAPDDELTYDPSRVMFLQEDRKDEAEIMKANAEAMRALTDAGYKAETVVDAVTSGDLNRLKHSGLFSVQLQEPGVNPPA